VRHRKSGRKLNRDNKARKALFRNLLTDFFLHEALVTTEAKAKTIKGKIDRLITKAKSPTLVNCRFIYSYLTKSLAAQKLIGEIAPRFTKRNSGYSRIIKLGTRRGDQAKMAKIELVAPLVLVKESVSKKSKKIIKTSSKKKKLSKNKPVKKKSLKTVSKDDKK